MMKMAAGLGGGEGLAAVVAVAGDETFREGHQGVSPPFHLA